ncbi:hypothetical protein [Cyclobacterium sp.]|uniref:hypothetical protein n=1 Tax=Cyclobacterium sp. TaxID=1966343 RepID=UPI0019C9EF87|nr:hypothetical protein [Cyclobacterium sp.]MBD3627292.1 hypothetical protein [Cyclobacterium sp.]
MKIFFLGCLLVLHLNLSAQNKVDFTGFDQKAAATVSVTENILEVTWPTGNQEKGKLLIDLEEGQPLFNSIQVSTDEGRFTEIARGMDQVFVLTEGKRDLTKGSGWNIFFDRTAYLPYTPHLLKIKKTAASVNNEGSRTNIILSEVSAAHFSGALEITLYDGSPLLNLAAVMQTDKDSVAIIYDAGLVNQEPVWEEIFWADTEGYLQAVSVDTSTGSKELAVKYRSLIGESKGGSLAIFPPPHQYFYPLDNAYNLKFTWYGKGYRDLIPGFGLGIRQDLMGDRRHVPWFNAPPGTEQRLNFFLLLSAEKDGQVLEEVKKYTHGDSYQPLPGYRTMASHFHTEHVNDVLTHKPLPEIPGHVRALRDLGVNIMHLGEFHLAGNPRDHGPRRLSEFRTMFEECARLSSGDFLMLPGEEPNSHFGGHWMNIFPKPVYWIMSREQGQPFVEEVPEYGKVYRVGNKEEMLRLLEEEKGLAWTAHARTKGSTGFPDQYRDEAFFHSDRFLGAAWKAIPADLSQPRIGKRVLDLMDDMANWGHKKYAIGEADLFKLEPEYEIYGHMNINYLRMDKLPKFEDGWQPVLDAMEKGEFFVTTGEVLIPDFTINEKSSGEILVLDDPADVNLNLNLSWTFPLNFVEVISGDGETVYREKISLEKTRAFGSQEFEFPIDLRGRSWVRVEVWDVAANGAFTQFIWLE